VMELFRGRSLARRHPRCRAVDRRAGRDRRGGGRLRVAGGARRRHHPPGRETGQRADRGGRRHQADRFRCRPRSSAEPTITGTGMILGSAAYLAPEVATGTPVGPLSDAWSLSRCDTTRSAVLCPSIGRCRRARAAADDPGTCSPLPSLQFRPRRRTRQQQRFRDPRDRKALALDPSDGGPGSAAAPRGRRHRRPRGRDGRRPAVPARRTHHEPTPDPPQLRAGPHTLIGTLDQPSPPAREAAVGIAPVGLDPATPRLRCAPLPHRRRRSGQPGPG